jgi:hypothetical protein
MKLNKKKVNYVINAGLAAELSGQTNKAIKYYLKAISI